MVENEASISTDDQQPVTEKKEKNSSRTKQKRSKSAGKYKSSKKDNHDRDSSVKSEKDNSKSELKIHVDIQDNSTKWNSRELHEQTDRVDNVDEKDGTEKVEDPPSQTHTKAPSRQRSTKKGKKGSRKQTEKGASSDKHPIESGDSKSRLDGPKRLGSDTFSKKPEEVGQEHRDKARNRGRSLKNSTRSRDIGGKKEDTKPSVPRRASDVRENEDLSSDKSPSDRKIRKNSRQKEEYGKDAMVEQTDDKQPIKPARRTARRVSPENKSDDNDDNELSVGSFHSLRKDSDKPRSRSNTRRRTPNSGRRNKTPTGGRSNRRRLKDKALNNSDHDDNNEKSDDIDSRVTEEIVLKDEEMFASGHTRARRERRRDRERLVSNDVLRDARKLKSNTTNGTRLGRSSLSTRRGGIRRSHSERWNRAVENLEGEGAENPHIVRRRAHESMNRGGDGLSRSAHSRIRRNHSSGLARMTGTLNNRSYQGLENDRRGGGSEGRRTPRRSTRRHQAVDSSNSLGDDSNHSFGDGHSYGDGRSQATLESIDDFEDFGEDFYGMELQTPGMIDFEEEMLDLMQRANPEVTDHLDRRVHRKREMVAYDHNMPMMTRQALLTRQASSQVQRQFFDGSNIDKKRLLLRNDSMGNSSHRAMRTHGRRVPPRAKSSGLGAMSRGGYMDSIGVPTRQSESDDRRRVFRSGSSQTASFNQFYQNKPNKVRNLSRRASGDLVQPHAIRGQSRSSDHRRRPVQRASSTTALRRGTHSDHIAPLKPERKMSEDGSRRRMALSESKVNDLLDGKQNDTNDMSNKRNRSKLHFLMYTTKMSVDMDVLFQKDREGETPRSPIDTLRMPSP
mmetsp:Transcript_7236/g.17644  ORF Transcript_7236/g.17644 Transcript_7236/m.17644 type:complete len:844 (+) Transcript_7236:204-2735(+)